MFMSTIARSVVRSGYSEGAFNPNQFGVLSARSASTAASKGPEVIHTSYQNEFQEPVTKRVFNYVEGNSHTFGAWYYLLGLVGTIISVGYALDNHINTKINHLDKKLNGKIDRLDQTLNGKIDHLDQTLNSKIDHLDEKLNGKIDRLDERIDRLEKSIRDSRTEFKECLSELKADMRMYMLQNRPPIYVQSPLEGSDRVIENK